MAESSLVRTSSALLTLASHHIRNASSSTDRARSGRTSSSFSTPNTPHCRIVQAWRCKLITSARSRRGGCLSCKRLGGTRYPSAKGVFIVASSSGRDRINIYRDSQPTEVGLIPVDELLGSEGFWDESDFADERTSPSFLDSSYRRVQPSAETRPQTHFDTMESDFDVEEAARLGYRGDRQASRGAAASSHRRNGSRLGRQMGLVVFALVGAAVCVVSWRSSTARVFSEHDTVPLAATTVVEPQSIMGHRRHPEAPPETLRTVHPGSHVMLRNSAAKSFAAMREAASYDGVNLIPISGYRSIQQQRELFFEIKAERYETAAQRARVSAPPGYSEHHTGYALDIGTSGVDGPHGGLRTHERVPVAAEERGAFSLGDVVPDG
eukprot:CAMPEP_0198220536 /NCGR_PEP_ID=MMETSP1445-20131203/79487_1 /TAXON_ID=36898 /ORGANISM="Pyramimonas sp., Strain CCMP2087" /LENGTH=379 /DNA_ID=CAMNT_0043898351 /DNA_START=198 /DNA_END=1336 /DNA_ORIENTATION=-